MDVLPGAASGMTPSLLWARMAADFGIAAVCLLVPYALAGLARRQPVGRTGWAVAAAAGLLAAAQLVDAWALWLDSSPLRTAAGVATALTALAFAASAWRLGPRLPQLLAQAASDSELQDMGRLGEVEAEARRLAAVVESTADAIVVKTLEGRITNWNAAAERMFGYTATEAVGQPIQMLVPPEREAEEMRAGQPRAWRAGAAVPHGPRRQGRPAAGRLRAGLAAA